MATKTNTMVAPWRSISRPPRTAPLEIAIWNVVSSSAPALSASSEATRVMKLCTLTGNAPKAKPQEAMARPATTGDAPAITRMEADAAISVAAKVTAQAVFFSARKPPKRLPKKPPIP